MADLGVGGHLYKAVDGHLIGRADMAWAAFLQEMREGSKEFGVNNNNAKERINLVFALVSEVKKQVDALPPQGRLLQFSGTATAKASEVFGKPR